MGRGSGAGSHGHGGGGGGHGGGHGGGGHRGGGGGGGGHAGGGGGHGGGGGFGHGGFGGGGWGGGPGFWGRGPGFWGPGWGGGPGYGGGFFLPCWLCCFFPPPPPPPVYARAPPVYVVNQIPLVNNPLLPREVTALEFREGDTRTKYMLTLPPDAVPGSVLRVMLGGREFSILLPDYFEKGENIVVIAPAASPAGIVVVEPIVVHENKPFEIRSIEFRDGDVASKYPYTLPAGVAAGQLISITISGRDFTIKIPDGVMPGASVVVIAPAPII